MRVGISEKVYNVRSQRSRSRVQMCECYDHGRGIRHLGGSIVQHSSSQHGTVLMEIQNKKTQYI